MSTIEDFENAPVGATAEDGKWVKDRPTNSYCEEWVEVLAPSDPKTEGESRSDESMFCNGYTLDPLPGAPKTAREALELAWELAHPVTTRQVLPEGTACLYRIDAGYQIHETPERMIARESWTDMRTLDPLPDPDPEPDWLDAPAVLAATVLEDRSERRTVFVRGDKTGTQWVRDTRVYRWDELIDVVPLYPKGQEA